MSEAVSIGEVASYLIARIGPFPEPLVGPYKKTPIPWRVRDAVLQRDSRRCRACGTKEIDYEVNPLCADHIIPESWGGKAVMANLQTLCRSCNSRKGSRFP